MFLVPRAAVANATRFVGTWGLRLEAQREAKSLQRDRILRDARIHYLRADKSCQNFPFTDCLFPSIPPCTLPPPNSPSAATQICRSCTSCRLLRHKRAQNRGSQGQRMNSPKVASFVLYWCHWDSFWCNPFGESMHTLLCGGCSRWGILKVNVFTFGLTLMGNDWFL